jgi:DNA-binding response OmpR family regulator
MRVLVCESTKDRAKLIEDLLKRYRYQVYLNDECTTLEQVKDINPSLIILNANQNSNVDFLVKLKKQSRYANIPVILISKANSETVLDIVNQLPNVDYLVEPFKIKNFRHIVERWITFRSIYVN